MKWFGTQKGNDFTCRLEQFDRSLVALRPTELTLSRLAQDIVDIFAADYCSIHACLNGSGWKSFSGIAAGNIPDCPDCLTVRDDHLAGTLELAEEQQLGVRNFLIPCDDTIGGLLVMKGESLSDKQIREIASAIGSRLPREVCNAGFQPAVRAHTAK